ncbi:hypothetical protein HGM15179_019462 [Zosterops borbonicus]|uniref:Chaperone DnaJ C-terminal domain-containing protein n=1 Tax=Zosterops borbonicus TaxID=364589 RepID=A0A8K1FVY1_9PASS|nr:hypothetical protein HGM15179_019462 [Zosterops borbonicus]
MDMDDDGNPFSAFIQFGYIGINGVHQRHQESLHMLRKVQDTPVTHELKVSLEEIYHGSTKRMKITHRKLNADGRTMWTEDKILNIDIKQGIDSQENAIFDLRPWKRIPKLSDSTGIVVSSFTNRPIVCKDKSFILFTVMGKTGST